MVNYNSAVWCLSHVSAMERDFLILKTMRIIEPWMGRKANDGWTEKVVLMPRRKDKRHQEGRIVCQIRDLTAWDKLRLTAIVWRFIGDILFNKLR